MTLSARATATVAEPGLRVAVAPILGPVVLCSSPFENLRAKIAPTTSVLMTSQQHILRPPAGDDGEVRGAGVGRDGGVGDADAQTRAAGEDGAARGVAGRRD